MTKHTIITPASECATTSEGLAKLLSDSTGYRFLPHLPNTPKLAHIVKRRPFSFYEILRHPVSNAQDPKSPRRTLRTALANALYIRREKGQDDIGPTPDCSAKAHDLIACARAQPSNGPAASLDGDELWAAADRATKAADVKECAAFHIVGALNPERSPAQWQEDVVAWCDQVLTSNGMVADWAVHQAGRPGEDGYVPPHAHLVVTARWYKSRCQNGRRHTKWFRKPGQIEDARLAWEWVAGVKALPYTTAQPAG